MQFQSRAHSHSHKPNFVGFLGNMFLFFSFSVYEEWRLGFMHTWTWNYSLADCLYTCQFGVLWAMSIHTHRLTNTLAFIVPSLSFPGSVCQYLVFFCLLLFYWIFLSFSLSFVHTYVLTLLSSCDTFMQSKFTSHLNLSVSMCRCMSSEYPSTRRATRVVETNYNAKLALFRWLSKQRTTLF